MKLLFIAATMFALPIFAHEGHDMPGALPPAPHGGVVKEAAHEKAHNHAEGKEEAELFFEVTYKNKEVKIYPLALLPSNTKTFVALSPEKDLSKVQLKIDLPRSKKSEILKPVVGKDAISAAFDAKGANRFFVLVGAEHGAEPKSAKVQIETAQ